MHVIDDVLVSVPLCDVTSHTDITFSVNICHDARVILHGSNQNLEIVLEERQDSSRCVIIDVGAGVVSHADPVCTKEILGCGVWRSFYVTWEGGEVMVGSTTGTSGAWTREPSFMTYMTGYPLVVQSVSVSGNLSEGDFEFGKINSKPNVLAFTNLSYHTVLEFESRPVMSAPANIHE